MCWQRWEQKFPLWSDDRSKISLTSSCSASLLFFLLSFTFIRTRYWRCNTSPTNYDYRYIVLLAYIKYFTCIHLNWLSTSCASRHCIFCSSFFCMSKVCVQCIHKTGTRSDLNTWLPDNNFALSYISEAGNKKENEVWVGVLFNCCPLSYISRLYQVCLSTRW